MVEYLEVSNDAGVIAVVKGKERVDIWKPGTGDDSPNGCILVGGDEMTPARARRFAELLFFAADHLEGLVAEPEGVEDGA